jgi:hypothetical protein
MIAGRVVLAALGVLALAAACGGSSQTGVGGDAGGGASSSGGTSSGSVLGGACPASTPGTKASCAASIEGVTCEYGDDPNLACDPLFTCTNGTWEPVNTDTSSTCPTPVANGGACPASYGAAETAGSCTATGTSCAYVQGRCECAVPTGGPPSVGGNAAKWLCDDPAAGCPMPRPRVGSTCSPSGLQCSYGACSIPDGIELVCTAGVWQTTPTACAL